MEVRPELAALVATLAAAVVAAAVWAGRRGHFQWDALGPEVLVRSAHVSPRWAGAPGLRALGGP